MILPDSFPAYLLLPFLAAWVFATGSLCFKRAFQEGVDPARGMVQTNVVMGLLFLPALWLDPHPFTPALLGWPILAGVMFFLGQCCNFAALRHGDVSLVTPIMGSKVVLVALCARLLFHFPLTEAHWIAAGLTTLGVFVLGATDLHRGRRMGRTTALAIGSSMCFALVDTVIQRGAPGFGTYNFMTVLFGTLGLVSAAHGPWLGRPTTPTPRGGRWWLRAAILLTATQALLISLSIGLWQDATGVNVVYSLRGVWGVVLVALMGRWFGNTERRDAGTRALWFRLSGAGLILLAVGITFLGTGGRGR